MSKPAASMAGGPVAGAAEALSPPEVLLRTFTEIRDELVSTLWFMLGNADDAQEMAQEVFLRCWRVQDNVPDIRDLKAWIFRVGLNAARDLQRSAYRRKVKPLFGEDIMQLADGKAPPEIVEDRPPAVPRFCNGTIDCQRLAELLQCFDRPLESF